MNVVGIEHGIKQNGESNDILVKNGTKCDVSKMGMLA